VEGTSCSHYQPGTLIPMCRPHLRPRKLNAGIAPGVQEDRVKSVAGNGKKAGVISLDSGLVSARRAHEDRWMGQAPDAFTTSRRPRSFSSGMASALKYPPQSLARGNRAFSLKANLLPACVNRMAAALPAGPHR